MNNEQLFQLCKKYGTAALEARRKFAGLLPEVNKRELFKKKGFESIYHFAAILAGMSNEQVNVALRLEKKFTDKPALKKALVEGEVSINKLARVASIATKENDEDLAEKAKRLSKSALDVFVKDEKSLPGHSNPQESLPDVNLLEHFSLELQKDLIKRHKKGIDINKLLQELLEKHDQLVEDEMEKIGNKAEPAKSNYIKAKTRKIIIKKYGDKCAIPGCNKPAENLHHTNYGNTFKIHDPRFIAPLCKAHHEIAHAKNLAYLKIRPGYT